MKTKFLMLAIMFFVLAVMLLVIGIYYAFQVQQAIWEFHYAPKTVPGSSGGGYPSYDGIWIYFEAASMSFAAGILIIVWRKRK